MRWSLDELYTSFESKDYKNDFIKLENMIEDFSSKYENIKECGDIKEVIESYIRDISQIKSLSIKISSYAGLSYNVDATNQVALKNIDRINNLSDKLTKPITNFQNFLKNIDNLDVVIDSSKLIKEHEFFIKEMYNNTKYMLSPEEEILISKLKNTGSSAWNSLQSKLLATLLVDIKIDGKDKKLPLSVVRNMAFDSSQDIRKLAYEAELKSYEKINESTAAALNSIKGEVITTSEIRGYDSPLEMTLIDSRMKKDTLETMLDAMVQYLPEFQKYFSKKAELLGHNNGLPFYDIFAPIGNMNTKFTYAEAMEYIVKNFNTFSPELGDFAQNAYENKWLDVEPREGKSGGAFCSSLHPIGESRILSNFTGSFSDMITLAHELGHGYHGYILKDESILNTSYPMPLAETASIFCETIVTNAALKTATPEEELTILEASLQDASQVIVDIYSRYLFETELFEKRKDYNLSVDEMNSLMIKAQKEAFGDSLDHNFLHPYMWLNKSHYYSAGRNFYNFPYAFGLLFAKGLYAQYLEEGDSFVSKYNSLLKVTGKDNIENVAQSVNIDIQDPKFFQSSLDIIKKDIDRFIELADKQ